MLLMALVMVMEYCEKIGNLIKSKIRQYAQCAQTPTL